MIQQRSTKGASKQRRDCINVEINQIKDVLPVSDNVRRRLSQLQVMALCNSYIAKSNCFLNALSVNEEQGFDNGSFFDFSEALPGFLLAINTDGKLLYISENVTEYLGHSMVEVMTQAENVYDIIDVLDHAPLRDFLVSAKIKHDKVRECSQDELDFTCRVNLGRLFRRNNVFDRQKMIKIRGRFIWPEGELHLAEPIFVARCSPVLSAYSTEQPTVMDTTIFHTSHSLDMKYTSIEEIGEFYLGYNKNELTGSSWYQFIHPDDTKEACASHAELVQGGLDSPRSLVARFQTKYGTYIWMHIVMYLGNSVIGPLGMECNQQEIFCLNHVLEEKDALETRHRENLDLMFPSTQYRTGGFEPARLAQEPRLPIVLVDERFMEPVTSQAQAKSSIPRDRQELMEKLKVIAMEKKNNKKPRLEDVKPSFTSNVQHGNGSEAFTSADLNGQAYGLVGFNMATNVDKTVYTESMNSLSVEGYNLQGPLTPPYSDDGRYDHSPASSYSPRSGSASLAYTPPYSPPNSLDDASLFDAVKQTTGKFNAKPAGKRTRTVLNTVYLPELDESAVENFFQDVEDKSNHFISSSEKLNSAAPFLYENNYLADSLLEEMSAQNAMGLELENRRNSGHLMQMMAENQNGITLNSFSNMLAAGSFGEESFLDMIESPLSLKTLDASTLQLFDQQLMM